MGVAMCSIKPDAVDLNTALYRQSVYVMFLDPVAEVAKMSTIHGNLKRKTQHETGRPRSFLLFHNAYF